MQSHELRTPALVTRSRDGIALVVVLGFLTLLVIMAMGFAISMRVERLSARNSVDLVKVRQLGEAALARVVSDVDEDLGDSLIPNWRGNWADGVFESVGSGVPMTNLLSGQTTNHVPRSLWNGARVASANAQWLPLQYVNNAGQTITAGRYAYLVLDCSGLFDVNFDYSTTNQFPQSRGVGLTPYEFRLDSALLGEVVDANWTKMITCRTDTSQNIEKPWYRLESVAELAPFLCQGYANAPPLRQGTIPSNFFCYSRFPQGYLDTSGQVAQPEFIGGTNFEDGPVRTVLQDMGITDVDNMILNLRDYMDADYQPGNLASFCTEMVPMINEVVVSNSFDYVNPTTYTNRYQVMVELWFPFGLSNPRAYNVRIGARYSGASINPPPLNQTINLSSPIAARSFIVVTSTVQQLASATLPGPMGNAVVDLAVIVQETTDGTKAVDSMGQVGGLMRIPIGQTIGAALQGGFLRGMSVNDPRINWNGQDTTQWRDNTPITLGTNNNAAAVTMTSQYADGGPTMYVRNGNMQVPGEMGLLLYDASRPWRTIDLLEGTGDFFPVLDRFTTRTNEVVYGLINPNSWNTGVVATAFRGMPVERFPGETGAATMSAAQALATARGIAAGARTITNISELGSTIISNGIRTAMGSALDIMQLEGAVRNSANLLSPRHNAFTVILAAQLVDEENNPIAETRGVGIVWRDPYPVDNRHQVYVRNFRWITE
jgi:hypothetical protein